MNKNILITGGASGVRKIMARRSLEKGAVLPRFIFDPLFGKLFGIYEVMDNFTGRKKA